MRETHRPRTYRTRSAHARTIPTRSPNNTQTKTPEHRSNPRRGQIKKLVLHNNRILQWWHLRRIDSPKKAWNRS